MRSIKPGRGPSGMSALGAAIAVIFGIFWTILAVSMGAPAFFPIFGVLFIAVGIVKAVYHFKNATGQNRFSSFDITEEGEEPDPLEERFGTDSGSEAGGGSIFYCPYCGARAKDSYSFCPQCGKELPRQR